MNTRSEYQALQANIYYFDSEKFAPKKESYS